MARACDQSYDKGIFHGYFIGQDRAGQAVGQVRIHKMETCIYFLPRGKSCKYARSCSYFFPGRKYCVCKNLLTFHPIPGQISTSLLDKSLSHSWPGSFLIPTHVPVSNLNPCLIPTKVPVLPVLSFPGLFPTLIITLKNLLTTQQVSNNPKQNI